MEKEISSRTVTKQQRRAGEERSWMFHLCLSRGRNLSQFVFDFVPSQDLGLESRKKILVPPFVTFTPQLSSPDFGKSELLFCCSQHPFLCLFFILEIPFVDLVSRKDTLTLSERISSFDSLPA